MAEADGVQQPSRIRPGLSWWQRLLGNLRKAEQVGTLRHVTFLLALCAVLASSLVHADDCSDALIAEACACRSTVPSKQEQPVSLDKGSLPDRRSRAGGTAWTHVAQRAKSAVSPSIEATLER
jgi:hypothetical protein